jgi:hypothetical protein
MPLAFRATYSDLKHIKTRQVMQVIFEVPVTEFDAAYEILGGVPNGASERWFAIAALKPEKTPAAALLAKPTTSKKQEWRDVAPPKQAGIRCDDPIFEAFLIEEYPDDWHESQDSAACVRLICCITSRSELATNQKARVIWHQLDEKFLAWRALERT